MATVELDRAQRKAIRDGVIAVAASAYGDVGLSMGLRGHRADRTRVVAVIEKLARWVALIDGVGWDDDPDGPDALDVPVSSELAERAQDTAVDIGSWRAPSDVERRAVHALRLISEVALKPAVETRA